MINKLKILLSNTIWDIGQAFIRWSYKLDESAYEAPKVGEATDLSNMIYRITPSDTPFTDLLKKQKNSRAEWQTDDLKPDDMTDAEREILADMRERFNRHE